MSLDKFLKKNKPTKKKESKPDLETAKTSPQSLIETTLEKNDPTTENQQENNPDTTSDMVNLPYEELLLIFNQIPSFGDFLTETIWIIEDGAIKDIEEYLSKQYNLAPVYITVLIREAKKIIAANVE